MREAPKVTLDTPLGPDVDLERDDVRTTTGRRLTEEVVEEFVTEARSAGRPSLTAPGVHSPSVTVRLSRDLNARLDREVERTGKRRSDIIREALDATLA